MAGHGHGHGGEPHWRAHGEWTSDGSPPERGGGVARRVLVTAGALIALVGTATYFGFWDDIKEIGDHPAEPWLKNGGGSPTPSAAEHRQTDLQNHNVHTTLVNSKDPNLQRLALMEDQFKYGVAANVMQEMVPRSVAEAQQQAKEMVRRLKEYSEQQPAGIQPIVHFAPHPDVDLKKLNNSANADYYRAVLDAYFAGIAQSGEINAQQMGVWVPFPSPNNPEGKKHGVVDPAIFTQNAVPAMQALKTHFNDAQVGLMLDTGHPTTPYLQGIPRDPGQPPMVDVLALRGYPNSPTALAATYLPAQMAIGAAKLVGAKDVLFDTGTASSYPQPNGSALHANTLQRGTQLHDTFMQMSQVSEAGLGVFANVAMSGNWAYAPNTPDSTLMATAVHDAQAVGYPVMFGV